MRELVNELMDKYRDVIETSDDWTEKNLASEILEDLHDIVRNLNG